MTSLFLYGTLRDLTLLETVLGRVPEVEPAVLPDHRVSAVEGQNFPMIAPEVGAQARGLVLHAMTDADLARFDYYEGPFAYCLQTRELASGQGAQVYLPEPDLWTPAGPWDLAGWQEKYGPVTRQAAREIMAAFGRLSVEEIGARIKVIETRAQARVNAEHHPSPVSLRHGLHRRETELLDHRQPYSHFFALEEIDIRFQRYSGELSAPVERAVFVSGDAVTVLPYDPVRDRVLLIEQFRSGAFLRGDATPWLLEAIAGRIDPYETPETTANREAMEEAGLTLKALHPVGNYYPSPGAMTEYLFSFVAIADLPDDAAGIGGLEEEAEDIRALVVSFDEMMAAVDAGEADNGPLLLSAYWLARHRDRLRECG